MKLCGFCKTLYPKIDKDTDETCIECREIGNDKAIGDL
jgi:hypothetical protein